MSFLKDAIGSGAIQEDKTEELDRTSGEWHTVRKELGYEDSDGDLRVFKHQGCQRGFWADLGPLEGDSRRVVLTDD